MVARCPVIAIAARFQITFIAVVARFQKTVITVRQLEFGDELPLEQLLEHENADQLKNGEVFLHRAVGQQVNQCVQDEHHHLVLPGCHVVQVDLRPYSNKILLHFDRGRVQHL